MLFSELYLAYKLAKSKEYQIILLDRSLSGTLSNLIYDTRNAPCGRDNAQYAQSTLTVRNLMTWNSPMADIIHPTLTVLFQLEEIIFDMQPSYSWKRLESRFKVAEIAVQLKCTEAHRVKRLTRYRNQLVDSEFLQFSNEKYSVNLVMQILGVAYANS